jgi:putative endonuclease
MTPKELGKIGERRATSFLKRAGYKIVEQNFSTPFGEIDIIAREKDYLCFIEVKTRQSPNAGFPGEGVGVVKQFRIARIAAYYLKLKNLRRVNCRFDVVAVTLSDGEERIELIRDAFQLPC